VSPQPEPAPLALVRELTAEEELYRVILDCIEERCVSFALDDEADREACAIHITSSLMSKGVKL
jgi:hypothetical protein